MQSDETDPFVHALICWSNKRPARKYLVLLECGSKPRSKLFLYVITDLDTYLWGSNILGCVFCRKYTFHLPFTILVCAFETLLRFGHVISQFTHWSLTPAYLPVLPNPALQWAPEISRDRARCSSMIKHGI